MVKIWICKAYEKYRGFLFINLGFIFITKKNFDYLWKDYIKPYKMYWYGNS